ncbi:thiamine phosphate synthase [Sphingomonas sp. S2-65]|uniref:thiamine phosphate synthase n=1 Tax=Sphingomonas sp. S2-65 TaxID=2903960 RepID=UPI001F21115F|nr:thiamine phosphate synthase [Sphingomonas sp. S2-65]UYY57311.1 thiamine phosphate synthase [Sphingomonas sp. S2-65]
MTDERMCERLWAALERMPRGSGVIFRHYRLPLAERRALFARVAAVARRRGLVLLRAGETRLGRGEDGTHGTRRRVRGWYSRSAHSPEEVVAGARAGADLLFVSPVFATRSHPGAPALGPVRLGMLVRGVGVPVIALGGMNARSARRLRGVGVYGWAGIDAWTG